MSLHNKNIILETVHRILKIGTVLEREREREKGRERGKIWKELLDLSMHMAFLQKASLVRIRTPAAAKTGDVPSK